MFCKVKFLVQDFPGPHAHNSSASSCSVVSCPFYQFGFLYRWKWYVPVLHHCIQEHEDCSTGSTMVTDSVGLTISYYDQLMHDWGYGDFTVERLDPTGRHGWICTTGTEQAVQDTDMALPEVTIAVVDCCKRLLARHLADVSCYIGPSMPSGICMEIHTKIVRKRKKKQSRDGGILGNPRLFRAPTRTTSTGCFMLHRTVHALWNLYGNPYRNRAGKEEETVT